jgi:hypothetical protein
MNVKFVEISDVEKLLAQRTVYQRFISAVRSRHNSTSPGKGKKGATASSSQLPAEAGLALSAMEKALEMAIFELCKTDHLDALECEGIPVVEAQRIAREVKLIDSLMCVLETPYEQGSATLQQLKPFDRALKLAFKALTCSFVEEGRNKAYVIAQKLSSWQPDGADMTFMEQITMQLKHEDIGAADCLTALVQVGLITATLYVH